MKKYIIAIIALVLSLSAMASNTNKKSYLYAVKGTDSLYLDHYVSPVSGKRPCMIYVFEVGCVRLVITCATHKTASENIYHTRAFTAYGRNVVVEV